MIKKITSVLMMFLSTSCIAAEITKQDILGWLTDKSTKTIILDIKPIYLENKELAYIASAEYPEQGNNFWTGYIIARPSLKIAQKLEGYGGQFNNITVYANRNIETLPSVLIIGSAGSGQGTFETTQYVVSIRDFDVNVHYQVYDESNSGACGKEFNGTACDKSETFLNFTYDLSDSNNITLIQSSIKQHGDSIKKLKSNISTKLITIPALK